MRTIPFLLLAGLLLGPTGCFFATQSYNTGRLLYPGMTQFGLGVGPVKYLSKEWMGYTTDSVYVSSGYGGYYTTQFHDIYEYQENSILSYSMHYRLGVLAKHPFGKGLEIGWLAQVPVPLNTDAAATLECDTRMGFKSINLPGAIYNHNLAVGWSIGQWVDNSWYAEYAGGYERGPVILYGNYRLIYAGTDYIGINGDPLESYSDENGEWHERLMPSKPSWNQRAAAGVSLFTGDIPVVPDYIIPEVTFIFPHYYKGNNLGVNWSIGLRWEFK